VISVKERLATLKQVPWVRTLLLFLAIVGPGIITANVDNDAGGITTYSVAGAQFGYKLLWIFIPLTIALIVVQEMSARMGAVTGKGLADLIRERFSLKLILLIMGALLVADLGNTMAEFSGVASSMRIFGVSEYIAVPLGALFVWLICVRGSFKQVERVFLVACLIFFTYIISGIMAKPDWFLVARQTVTPTFQFNAPYVAMLIGVVGTTIAPWMQFYIQSAIVEKGVTAKSYKFSRVDVIIGCIITDIVAVFIIVACAATINAHGLRITDAADAARALAPLAGKWASTLFAIGLLNASLFAAAILPLATAYYVCEALGLEAGLNKKWSEAPAFYWLFTVLVVVGSGIILIPGVPLLQVMLWSQVINGSLLPFILIYVLVLINDRKLMGEHVNGRTFNIIAWGTTVIMIGLTFLLVLQSIFPKIFG
jgi:NRAMP (natural resistance-associated macrophage protein)-like metal ion transporter